MNTQSPSHPTHPLGESFQPPVLPEQNTIAVDTYAGRIHVEWDPQAAVTPLGQLPFFIDFLKTADLFAPWVRDCPLEYASPNAPSKVNVLGTVLLSMLSGHRRYSHITTLQADSVNPDLLGMTKVVSEDSVRRAFKPADEDACCAWLQSHLKRCYLPLLYEPWILDIDTTIKTLYGRQEGAKVGYNPHKPGRPSHVYHSYFMANLRLALDVEIQPGNQTASSFSAPGLWKFLDDLPRAAWPCFIRGDCGFGNEAMMRESEKRALPYLFKLRQSANVKRLIEQVFERRDWTPAGQGWEAVEDELRLKSWSKTRRVLVFRRPLSKQTVVAHESSDSAVQLEFPFVKLLTAQTPYEYAVLITSLPDEILSIAQHYRDRGDMENNFDELKNQWGWGGYTTQDLKRCAIAARTQALIYNWWSLFVRLAIPQKHAEAITSRPLLLHAVAKQTKHQGQTKLTITSTHGKTAKVRDVLSKLSRFFSWIRSSAEQLTWEQRWRLILSHVFRYFLNGRPLASPCESPVMLPSPT